MPKRPYRPRRPPGISDHAAIYSGDAIEHKALVGMLAALKPEDATVDRLAVLGRYINPEKLAEVMDLFGQTLVLWTKANEAGREPSATMMLFGAQILYEMARSELSNSLRPEERLKLPLLYEGVREVAVAHVESLEQQVEAMVATADVGQPRPRRGKKR